MIISGYMTVTNPLFIRLIRLQNSRFFFSKSVKKSVKRGVRVLRARACEAREKKRLSPVLLSVFSLVPDLLFDCSRVLEYAKIWTVLQPIGWWTSRDLVEICQVLSSCSKFFITCQLIFKDWVEFCLVILWMLLSSLLYLLIAETKISYSP